MYGLYLFPLHCCVAMRVCSMFVCRRCYCILLDTPYALRQRCKYGLEFFALHAALNHPSTPSVLFDPGLFDTACVPILSFYSSQLILILLVPCRACVLPYVYALRAACLMSACCSHTAPVSIDTHRRRDENTKSQFLTGH